MIVNTASIAGLIGLRTSSAYVAAKHGVIGLTKSAAVEYAETGLRVNAVCPGYIETRMTAPSRETRGDAIIARTPMRRYGQPREIAEMVVWFCSDRASYVTGAAYEVDGGSDRLLTYSPGSPAQNGAIGRAGQRLGTCRQGCQRPWRAPGRSPAAPGRIRTDVVPAGGRSASCSSVSR